MNSLIQTYLENCGNYVCFECGVEHPKWSSINNGILLCNSCASLHRELGINLSEIRSLTLDHWDEKNIKYLEKGGNEKFKEFLFQYNLLELSVQEKYRTKAAIYYREKLRCEVEEILFPLELDQETAHILIESKILFESSKPKVEQTTSNDDSQGYLASFLSYFSSAAQKTKEISEIVVGKSYEISGMIVDKSKNIQEKSIELGEMFLEKGKEKYTEGLDLTSQLLEKGKEKLIEGKEMGAHLFEKGKEKGKEKVQEGKEMGAHLLEKSKEKLNEGKVIGTSLLEKGMEKIQEGKEMGALFFVKSMDKMANFQMNFVEEPNKLIEISKDFEYSEQNQENDPILSEKTIENREIEMKCSEEMDQEKLKKKGDETDIKKDTLKEEKTEETKIDK